jgi:heme/copper-type cytochrome/quinol oxidase subunit 2
MTDPHAAYVAHHMILLAIPAFLPAIIVVGVIVYIALKDRRSAGEPEDAGRPSDENR